MSVRYASDEAVEAVRAQRARTITLAEGLHEAQWEQIATPGWRVREVIGHLIATDEASLTGKMLRLGLKPVPIEELEEWNERHVRDWSGRSIPALVHGLEVWGRRIARAIAAAPASLRLPGPFGSVPAPWLGMMRVYDEWIHGEDIRRALGMEPDTGAGPVGPVARHLFEVIPLQTLPRLPESANGTVGLGFTDLPGPMFGVDMQAHTFGEHVEARTHITGPAATIVMIASGRDAWRDAEAAGMLHIDGDRTPAEVFLDALIAV